MSELIHLPAAIAPDPQGQQTGVQERLKRVPRRYRIARVLARLTRLAGPLRPGRARSRRQEETMSPAAAPTERQLRYLRSLANRTATTFLPPRTRGDASQEIERLIALSRDQPAPLREPEDSEPAAQSYATAVHPDEVSGFGSTAAWRSRPGAPRGTAEAPTTPVRLLSYRVAAGERVLLAERRGGRVYVSDVPADGEGERFAVEEFEDCEGSGPLRALVADYGARARELDEIPMAGAALLKTLSGVTHNG